MLTFAPLNYINIILMKKLTFLTLMALASAHGAMAQTQADSLRADSIFKSLELQGVEVVKQKALVKSDIDKIT